MTDLKSLKAEIRRIADPVRARFLEKYFKTGKGEYGEGDIFLGLAVPVSRSIAKEYKSLDFTDVKDLLASKFHEERLIALLILVQKFNSGDEKSRKEIYEFYLDNTKGINNWDLVDLSAPEIVGTHLLNEDRKILYKLAKSKNIWEKRISAISTFMFIKNHQFEDSLKISEILLQDKHDLIHKAVGWMLREIGKRDLKAEIEFLDKHYKKMPRTMLRYAIEKFPEKQRLSYLKKD